MAKSREASGHLGGNDWGRRKFWKFGGNFWSVIKAFLLLESLSGALNHLNFSKIFGGCAPARALPLDPAEAAAPQTPAGAL